MSILEERGIFWWHDQEIPEGQFAPGSCVTGLLKIEDDGRITLELDGLLLNPQHPMSALGNPAGVDLQDKCIQGHLKESGRKILLVGLLHNGGRFSTSGMTYERYLAMNCLAGDQLVRESTKSPTCRKLEIGLEGFEQWLRLGAIQMTRSQSGAVIKYETPQSVEYLVDDGRLSINFDVSVLGSEMFYNDALSLKESASMVYELNNALTLEELKGVYALFEDLLILLTDSDYRLGWPSVVLSDESRYRWYFARIRNVKPASAPQYFECWTNFKQLRETFGSIWTNWKKKREEFGAGIYLYLGTRRGIPLYLEHRFVNLLWGIESFHRTRHAAHESGALSAKIHRIIEQVSLKKDKKWLERRLRHAGEPSLEERIFDAFKDLPTDIDHARLRAFCKSCADLRNAISHFGGHRQGSYTEFIRELDKRSDALSTLYHTLLLQEIGVDEKILMWWIYEGFRSYAIKANFVEVGLLDKSCLKVENVQGAETTTGKK